LANLIIACLSYGQKANPFPQLTPIRAGGSNAEKPDWKIDTVNSSSIHRKYLSVAYGNISATQTLDIYLPDKGNGPFPVIIVIHGGAFAMGHSRMLTDVGPMMGSLQRGYAIVSVNYRLSGEALFPAAVNDVKAAVRFVKAHAPEYHLNPFKIAAWGGSAGGNMVAMIGTTGQVNDLDGENTENLQYTSTVQAVVDWFGPCDFLKFDEQFKASGFTEYNSSVRANSSESYYIGQHVAKDTAFTELANPETYIPVMEPKTAPYFFIQHGTLDPVVPMQQSIHFAQCLKTKLGSNKVTVALIPGAHHFSPEFSSPENLNKVFAFLDAILKP